MDLTGVSEVKLTFDQLWDTRGDVDSGGNPLNDKKYLEYTLNADAALPTSIQVNLYGAGVATQNIPASTIETITAAFTDKTQFRWRFDSVDAPPTPTIDVDVDSEDFDDTAVSEIVTTFLDQDFDSLTPIFYLWVDLPRSY